MMSLSGGSSPLPEANIWTLYARRASLLTTPLIAGIRCPAGGIDSTKRAQKPAWNGSGAW
jgi:hypothetical protein